MMIDDQLNGELPAAALLALVAMLIGWIINIVKLSGLDFAGNEIEVVIRACGILVAPLGGIIGWVW